MKTYLITGGSGFIGSNFIENLKKKQNFIINLDKKKPYKITNHLSLKNYKFIKGSINNKNLLLRILKNYKPDYIINFAAETHVDKSIYSPEIFFKNNVDGTLNLLKCLVENNYKKIFVQISTDEVYGELKRNEKAFREESKISPKNTYSISKATADHLVQYYSNNYNLNCIITRCTNNFGIWQHPEKLIPNTIMNCIKKQKIPIYGDGKNIRDWINVKDHCLGIEKVIKKGKRGQIYLIGSNNEITNIKIAKLITKYFQLKNQNFHYKNLITYVQDRLSHDKRYAINFDRAKKELNFSPQHNFINSLNKTIDHYIDNQKFYNSIVTRSKWFKKHYG